MAKTNAYLDTYTELLKAYVLAQSEQPLAQASQLGRQLVEDGVSLEHVAEIHERAVGTLRKDSSDEQLLDLLDHVHTPFMELLMAYGMTSSAKDDRIHQDQIKLKETHARLKCIIDQAGEAIISIDANNHISMFNGMAIMMFGYREEDAIGQPIDLLLPQSAQHYYGNLIDRFRNSDDRTLWIVKNGETNFVRHDKTEFPVQASISNVVIKNEQILTLMVTDVTEQKKSQDALKQLNETLEDRVKRRTAELQEINQSLQDTLTELSHSNAKLSEAQKALVDQAHAAGMSEIATNVLHNVGNVLNSVNVSAQVLTDHLQKSQITGLAKATDLIKQHRDDLSDYISQDKQGKHLPEYLIQLSDRLYQDQKASLDELKSLTKNIEHIKQVVSSQQSVAKVGGVYEPVNLEELVGEALQINLASFERHHITLDTQYETIPLFATDKQKILQILVNLIGNARHAMKSNDNSKHKLTLRIEKSDNKHARITVADDGVGIDPEHLSKIFQHGFTTKEDGHGFGLHSAALAANEIGGSLAGHSDGHNTGATFTLEIPLQHQEAKVA